jgi:hypothetical protein
MPPRGHEPHGPLKSANLECLTLLDSSAVGP